MEILFISYFQKQRSKSYGQEKTSNAFKKPFGSTTESDNSFTFPRTHFRRPANTGIFEKDRFQQDKPFSSIPSFDEMGWTQFDLFERNNKESFYCKKETTDNPFADSPEDSKKNSYRRSGPSRPTEYPSADSPPEPNDQAGVAASASPTPVSSREELLESLKLDPNKALSRKELFILFGLEQEQDDKKAFDTAYKRCMLIYHPDRGGNESIAKQITNFRDQVYKERRWS